ncbi:N-acetylneuraminate synthase [Alphaproteobacteria bacterium]|nr:N-acetylneuraminate synthase [Alphaproteobacteria bacterium]
MKTVVIAEAGVNHNGSLDLAKEMVNVAASAGADYVKFQSFDANSLVTQQATKAAYQESQGNSGESQLAMLRKLELSRSSQAELVDYCARQKIGFLSTAFDSESLEFLLDLDCLDYLKVPSGEITNLPLMRQMAKSGLPILLSTGLSDMADVTAAVNVFRNSVPEIILLHCTSEYPAPFEDLNLRCLHTLHDEFGFNVGYSDHSLGIEVAIGAVAMGARFIEKHFTLDKSMPGPDHMASVDPKQLAEMIAAIRNIESALGGTIKRPSQSEEKNKTAIRKSIVARELIATGDMFTEDNLTTKRPGDGLSPMMWDSVIGRKSTRVFAKDEMIEI